MMVQKCSKKELEALAEFRYQLRRFLRFSEDACRGEGLTTQQYQLLLQVEGFAGRHWASVGELAERLQSQPHGAVALVTRCEALGLVERRPSARDGRVVEVHLTPLGASRLQTLAQRHRQELETLKDTFTVSRVTGDDH